METSSAEIEELRARIAKLEKRNWKRLWLILPLLFLLGVWEFYWAVSPRDSISTRNLTIVDEHGNGRAYMNYSGSGVGLVFMGQNGKVRAGFNATDDGYASISLSDTNGTPKVMFGSNPDASSYFILNGNPHKMATFWATAAGDSAYLKLRNADSTLVLSAK